MSGLEKGLMVPVLQCLSTLRTSLDLSAGEEDIQNHSRKRWYPSELGSAGGVDIFQGDILACRQQSVEDEVKRQISSFDSRFQDSQNGPALSGPSPAFVNHAPHKCHERFHFKQGHIDLSSANILELSKSKSLDNLSTQSLFNLVNGILDDSIKRKDGDVSHCVAYLLRKVVQVIEQRISTHSENLKHQNNIFMSREEKYQLKIKVLETLAAGATEENEVVINQLQRLKIEKVKLEEKKKHEEQDLLTLQKQKDHNDLEILSLKKELELTKRAHDHNTLQLEENAKEAKAELEKKLLELECLLTDSRKKVKELDMFSESKSRRWKKKERIYQNFVGYLFGKLQDLRVALESIKHEVLKTNRNYSEEFNYLETKLKGLEAAAQSYHAVLVENRRLYNEVQDLKGNIRVYCRIRPFLAGQSKRQTTIEYIGENGELVITNPSKQGKDSRRLFKFNKVFGPACSQEEVFLDTQPLIQSVLDGYNVCIFAYGQTGSGKTYTMSGPGVSSKESWGVNYRALNDLFQFSESRKGSIAYEVGVQMIEIYNEQVHDLLSHDGPQKRLGIWNTTQPNGLAVPDASMHPVNSTDDVFELMNIGLINRAVGATALNERSSRSHSVLTVHVRGTDLETDAVLRANLHLVDLAGSERVDRSEATGDRLKEAQHINKSLSALGDVIFALAQKSPHVPYRNSKLTQVLQSSLGGQAKTLMFVQLNPDVESYSETISTLKFAERVSGVELGAARSNREGRYLRKLMEQVSVLKETIANRDEEIERLQLLKANADGVKHASATSSLRYGSSCLRRHSVGTPRQKERLLRETVSGLVNKAPSDGDNFSEYSEKHSDSGSNKSMSGFRYHKETSHHSKHAGGNVSQNCTEDVELLGFKNAGSDGRLSDISHGGLSMGTETDGSICSVVEYTIFPEVEKPADNTKPDSRQPENTSVAENTRVKKTSAPNIESSEKIIVPSELPEPPQKQVQPKASRLSLTRTSSKGSSSARKVPAGSSSSSAKAKGRQ